MRKKHGAEKGVPGAAAPVPPGPGGVFTTLAGGLGTLPPVLAAASGAEIRTRATVRELARRPGGWRLTIGSAHAPQWLDADAVILAVPAAPASRLLAPSAGDAAAALAGISYASMAVITLAYPEAAFPVPPAGSGFLVPPVDGHAVKAVTFSTVKWPHLAVAGLQIVRCSVAGWGMRPCSSATTPTWPTWPPPTWPRPPACGAARRRRG